jgi:ABC-type Fe3+-siderophore transport system permease subunit
LAAVCSVPDAALSLRLMNTKVEEDEVGSDLAVIRRGAMAGLLAGATLMVVFFVMDLLTGQPLATPTCLSGV